MTDVDMINSDRFICKSNAYNTVENNRDGNCLYESILDSAYYNLPRDHELNKMYPGKCSTSRSTKDQLHLRNECRKWLIENGTGESSEEVRHVSTNHEWATDKVFQYIASRFDICIILHSIPDGTWTIITPYINESSLDAKDCTSAVFVRCLGTRQMQVDSAPIQGRHYVALYPRRSRRSTRLSNKPHLLTPIAKKTPYIKKKAHYRYFITCSSTIYRHPYTYPYSYMNKQDKLHAWVEELKSNYVSDVKYIEGYRKWTNPPVAVLLRTLMFFNNYTVIQNTPLYINHCVYHHSEKVQNGLFSLISFKKGTCVGQFTGSVHVAKDFSMESEIRNDYVLPTSYRGVEYIINPLNEPETAVDITNYGALINEPSVVPNGYTVFTLNDGHSTYGHVVKYDHLKYLYTLDSGEHVDATQLYSDNDNCKGSVDDASDDDYDVTSMSSDDDDVTVIYHKPVSTICDIGLKHIANCIWVPFPVPLEFYKTDDEETWTFCNMVHSKVSYEIHEVCNVFQTFINETHEYEMTPENFDYIEVGCVFLMKADIFNGLHRYATVTEKDKWRVVVTHAINEYTFWRLPQTIKAGKVQVGGNTRYIPFPLIYAYDDIPANTELLCLYNDPVNDRGAPCRLRMKDSVIDDSILGPMWNVVEPEHRPESEIQIPDERGGHFNGPFEGLHNFFRRPDDLMTTPFDARKT